MSLSLIGTGEERENFGSLLVSAGVGGKNLDGGGGVRECLVQEGDGVVAVVRLGGLGLGKEGLGGKEVVLDGFWDLGG